MSVLSLKALLFFIFPVTFIAALVRGDAPAWFYIAWPLAAASVAFFTFVFLPKYQDWFNGKDLRPTNDDA